MKSSLKLETVGKYHRFRIYYRSQRYTFNLSPELIRDSSALKLLEEAILSDLKRDCLDTSLKRYQEFFTASSLHSLYEEFTKSVGLKLIPYNHYYSTYKMLEQATTNSKDISINNLADYFTSLELSPGTFNRRKGHLIEFYNWLIHKDLTNRNPFLFIKPKPVSKILPASHRPFTADQIVRILTALKTDEFCAKKNQFKHSYYYYFVKFLFHTGVRVGEAAALKVYCLNLCDKTALVEETWSKKTKSFNTAKSDSIREIQLTDEIVQDLTVIVSGKKQEDLVFPGPRNKPIDSNNFNDRVFFPVLDGLKLPKRVIYSCRHTYASLAIKQQVPLPELQQQLGHNSSSTTMKYYVLFQRAPIVNLTIPKDSD